MKSPTEIQKAIIPHVLNEEDCIGCAKTGSGKTLAFALPILQKWCEDPYGIFALILTPTRELAYQVMCYFFSSSSSPFWTSSSFWRVLTRFLELLHKSLYIQ